MVLKVSYPVMDRGNTVPYPPLYDDIRRNHGFVDLRGRPSLVSKIPEAKESDALCSVLMELAKPNSHIMSLGCDLGEHEDRQRSFKQRRIAGGYIQVCRLPLETREREDLISLSKSVEIQLNQDVGNSIWKVEFALCRTDFNFEFRIETHSIWIWFYACSSTWLKARQSREQLLDSLGAGFCGFTPSD